MSTGSVLGLPPLGLWLVYMDCMIGVRAFQLTSFSVLASISPCLLFYGRVFLPGKSQKSPYVELIEVINKPNGGDIKTEENQNSLYYRDMSES